MLGRYNFTPANATPPERLALDDLLTGRCPTCASVIECRRADATPPQQDKSLRHRSNAEAGGFGAWLELWSIECPVCKAKTMSVTSVKGKTQQEKLGPRVYLTKKA